MIVSRTEAVAEVFEERVRWLRGLKSGWSRRRRILPGHPLWSRRLQWERARRGRPLTEQEIAALG